MRKDYEILGIEENADERTVKKAYFKLIRTYSPEKDPERFQEIRAAYERLMENEEHPEEGVSLEIPKDKLAMSMYDQIQQLMHEQEYARAAETAKEGMKYYKDAECFQFLFARNSFLDDKSGTAVKAYEELVKKYPQKLYYKSELARAYHMRGYMRKAYIMFQEVYQEGGRNLDFLLEYSLCCLDRQQYDEAVKILDVLVASVPVQKMKNWIPELIQAYMEYFSLCKEKSYSLTKVIESFKVFLDQTRSLLSDYEDMLCGLYLLFFMMAENGTEGVLELLERLEQFVPELKDMMQDQKAKVDERFSPLMKYTIETFASERFFEEKDEKYEVFRQMDAILCNIEEWPNQKKDIELLKKEYPAIYEESLEFWAIFMKSKEELRFIKESILWEYVREERKYQNGKYFEWYPEKRQDAEKIQWDSTENGTFVRDTKKIGRNDPCPCGSGKKYKNCCGKN